MKSLMIIVCEKIEPEYQKALEIIGAQNVKIQSFPCLCEKKNLFVKVGKQLQNSASDDTQLMVISGTHCDMRKLLDDDTIDSKTSPLCFNSLERDPFVSYAMRKGGYIVASGWLASWRKNLDQMGFDKETAGRFYREACKELVFLDSGIDLKAENKMRELSEYLGLPYIMISFDIQILVSALRELINQWHSTNKRNELEESLRQAQTQYAEYSAMLNLMGKISSSTSRRDVLGKLKKVFVTIFGARKFAYYEAGGDPSNLHEEMLVLLTDPDKCYLLFKEENRFLIALKHDSLLFGIIEAGEFLFPQYIEKYLNMAIEITRISGLVFTNVLQYERLIESETNLEHISFHDALTGLYNRTFFNAFVEENSDASPFVVFSFDVDGLKHVNDSFGHSEGDKLIRKAANTLKRCCRSDEDLLARVGGDEFIAVLRDFDPASVDAILRRLESIIRSDNAKTKTPHLKLSISAGFAYPKSKKETFDSLVHRADSRMYENKRLKKENARNEER